MITFLGIMSTNTLTIDQQLSRLSYNIETVLPDGALEDRLKTAEADGRPLKIKLGVDPTAPDLHLGHTVVLRKLRDFQDCGHEVTLLIGDFTARIGDPSGRNSQRPPLTGEDIDANAKTYAEQAFKILDKEKTSIRYNSEWLSDLSFEEVVRLASRFNVARMLERDDFAKRYTEGRSIAVHEFLYPVMQAYDSVVLGSDVELGGTDQTFNLLAGRQLQEAMGQEPQVCITLPILEGTDGVRRMGKSLGNYVGVSESPEEMFGKTMSIPDEMMVRWYRLVTDIPTDEIDAIEAGLADGSAHPGKQKRSLAKTIIAMYQGDDAAIAAESHFDSLHKSGAGAVPPSDVLDKAPVLNVSQAEADTGIGILELFVRSGLAASNREARRLVDGGGARIDGEQTKDPSAVITPNDGAILQSGKRKFAKIVVS